MRCVLLLLLCCLGLSAQAQTRVWIPPSPDLKPIVLDTVAIEVKMQGFIAQTRIDMSFENPNARVLEGEFVFPLGPGQTVTGYALEVNGALREGVVVPKETARVAFEDTTRVQIDPGLAELTRGNVFRTRLYPIPAQGKKRIVLEFEQVMDDAGTHWRYLMPLQFREPIRHFSVTAEAPLDEAAPEVGSDSPDSQLQFDPATSVWRASFSRENITPQRELAFRVPKQGIVVTQLEAPDALEPAERALVARIDTGRPTNLAPLPSPKVVALYFDASGSANDRDLPREHELLATWFKSLGTVDVSLIAVRDVASAPQHFTIKNGDATALLDAIKALALDGASNYGTIDFRAVPRADLAIVIGDGLDTYGSGHTDFTGAPARVFVLHAAQRADHARLDEMGRHGGQVLDLSRIDAAAALAALSTPTWRLLDIGSEGQCRDIAPLAPQPVNAVLTLTARCTGSGRLHLRFGSAEGTTTVERSIAFGSAKPTTGALAEVIWRRVAQARIAQLQAESKPDAEAITKLAVTHGVVSAYTSLLVLDRIEDYVRYRVEPREDALKAEYQRLLAHTPKANTNGDRDTRLAGLATRWRAFRDWHAERHAWLETLLLPTAQSERDLWMSVSAGEKLSQKELDAQRTQLDGVLKQSKALTERWASEGAQAATRAAWKREATQVMLQLDAIRNLRLERGLVSAATNDEVTYDRPTPMSAPPPVAAAPAAPAYEEAMTARQHANAQSLDAAQATMIAPPPPPVAQQKTAEPAMQAQIELAGWNPDTPYLKALRAAKDPYSAYLGLRAENVRTPTFFLDVADYFRNEVKDSALALRVLSNLAEIGDENTALIRILGYRLVQWDRAELAIRPFEDALAQRPEEPQSHRDLALALARTIKPDVARAAALLWTVASGEWSSRFPDIDLIALHELTALLAAHPDTDVRALNIPAELLTPVELGLRVVLTWDADNTDIDLHVIDPAGEEVFYSHPRSASGGDLSRDFTQGYGPEVFTIARPLPGTYRVQTNYFGDRRQSITGPVSLQVEFQTAFGSHEPTRQATTVRLESRKERIDIGRFRVAPADAEVAH